MVQPGTDEAETSTALDDEALPEGVGRRMISVDDPEIELWVPVDDVDAPEFSIVIPAMNEAITISTFVEWCRSGLEDAGVTGEILIIDSSSDDTPHLAVQGGARILRTPKRGLGRAYIDAIPFIRGEYVIMGDADCTYDFRELSNFVEAFRAGNDYVMGSRWKGSIEKGSMPWHHQYFGTPLTTWILNFLYRSDFSDIHCGMRGITRDALVEINLRSQSWEYASEMVLKSVRHRLRTAEVPVSFLKDREGRLSHHRRSGWTSPFSAAWINLRAMFVYGADFFLVRPGIALTTIGSLLTVMLTFGPLTFGPVTLSGYWQLMGVVLFAVGLQGLYLGLLAQTLFDYTNSVTARRLEIFSYTRSVLISAASVLAGVGLAMPLILTYIQGGLRLAPGQTQGYMAATGMAAVIAGFSTFTFTLVLHAMELRKHEYR